MGTTTFELTATAGSGLPITFASHNPDVATVMGSTVTLVGPGTATISAEQPGNADYLAATPVGKTLTVSTTPTVAVPALPPWALIVLMSVMFLAVGIAGRRRM